MSIDCSLGYKIPIAKSGELVAFGHGLFGIYEFQYMFNQFSNAIYGSVAPTFYLGKKRQIFTSVEFFSRLYWFDQKRIWTKDFTKKNYNSTRSERNRVLGTKVMVGYCKVWGKANSYLFLIKGYTGVSLRIKNYHYENINNRIVDDYNNPMVIPYTEENGTLFFAAPQLVLS